MKDYRWRQYHNLDENQLFLSVYADLPGKQPQNLSKQEELEKEKGKRVIIIDMMSPNTGVCQIDLQ